MKVHLGGKGDPIPLIALPDPSILGELPSTVLEFKDGDNFDKSWWETFGFTHYEVWCVGAAGGRGGSVGRLDWSEFHFYESMPPQIWEYYKEQQVLEDEGGMSYQGYDGTWWHESGGLIYTPGWYPGRPDLFPYGGTDYWVHWADRLYPNRDPIRAVQRKNFFLAEEVDNGGDGIAAGALPPFSLGGGGGGGGTQIVHGELSALPDFSPIVIGQVGADSGPGQVRVNGPWTPAKNQDFGYYLTEGPLFWSGYQGRWEQLTKWLAQWQYRFPSPMPSFYPPEPGQDGEASSFGGDICRASGGKGGRPSVFWDAGVRKMDGAGGAGGVGGQLEAGGGAAGSNKKGAAGADGTWINNIGKGGGGGIGGVGHVSYTHVYGEITRDATSGGRGTMSYADTSIYGKGEPWSYWIRVDRFDESHDVERPPEIRLITTTSKYVPGGGGGVRALRKYPYGSKAPGYNPNGHVLIRLTKVS